MFTNKKARFKKKRALKVFQKFEKPKIENARQIEFAVHEIYCFQLH